MSLIIYGTPLSPFVRKVRVCLAEKGLDYELEEVSPFDPPEGWRTLSPLGRIPVLRDTEVGTSGAEGTIADSSAICAYLERGWPQPALYPSAAFAYARALWFEEYGDTELAARIGFGIWRTLVVGPMNGQPADEATARETVEEKLPKRFDYLEGALASAAGGWLVGDAFSIADVSCATHLVNFLHAGYRVDAARWPTLAAWLDRCCERPSFAGAIDTERGRLGAYSKL